MPTNTRMRNTTAESFTWPAVTTTVFWIVIITLLCQHMIVEETEAMTIMMPPQQEQPQRNDNQNQQQQGRIFAIRHGQSEWNVLHEMYPAEEDRFHPRMKRIDSDMTDLGVQQCKDAGKNLSNLLESMDVQSPDYVMVSPLRRALYTASLVLESFPSSDATPSPIKVEVRKDCTEVLIDSCDIGSPPSVLSNEFPHWDFSHLDEYWWYGGHNPEKTWSLVQEEKLRETESHVLERIESLKTYLRGLMKAYTTIVIVCHSETIWYLTSSINTDTGERFGTMTKNAEILDVTSHIILEQEYS